MGNTRVAILVVWGILLAGSALLAIDHLIAPSTEVGASLILKIGNRETNKFRSRETVITLDRDAVVSGEAPEPFLLLGKKVLTSTRWGETWGTPPNLFIRLRSQYELDPIEMPAGTWQVHAYSPVTLQLQSDQPLTVKVYPTIDYRLQVGLATGVAAITLWCLGWLVVAKFPKLR